MKFKAMTARPVAALHIVSMVGLAWVGCEADNADDVAEVAAAEPEDAGFRKAIGCDGRCSASCRCELGEGDCDRDADCAPGLICPPDKAGKEVCQRPPNQRCDGRCSPSCPCDVGEGDCDKDSDCKGSLVCPPDRPGKDVCARPTGGDCETRCSPACPCQEGEGDCDKDSDCEGSLICPPDGPGRENCQRATPRPDGDSDAGARDTGPDGELHIVVFSVGSADAALIVFPTGATMLMDSATERRFADRVLPFLRRHGIRHLDYYAETHPHQDHIGGRTRLKNEGLVDDRTDVWDWETFDYGDSFALEGTDWFIYNARDRSFHGSDANANSLSFRMEYKGFVYSSTGDEGPRAQRRFMRDHPGLVEAHVRNTAHHMWGPTSQPFLVATNPYLMIISSVRAVKEEISYRRDFMGAVRQLERTNGRLRDHVLTAEVGHVIIRARDARDWSYDFCPNTASCTVPGLR